MHLLLFVCLSLESQATAESWPRNGILIGPEGGFTAEELQQLGSHSAVRFVSLGNNVLRSETAAVAALSVISASYQLS